MKDGGGVGSFELTKQKSAANGTTAGSISLILLTDEMQATISQSDSILLIVYFSITDLSMSIVCYFLWMGT